MYMSEKRSIKVAILDLYEGIENQGMRCIREILNQYSENNNLELLWDEFEVRIQQQLPDLSYDIYISSGGPGSPLESENSEWERKYFQWLSDVENFNKESSNIEKKYVLFICHSFQLACRHYEIAKSRKASFYCFWCLSRTYVGAGERRTGFCRIAGILSMRLIVAITRWYNPIVSAYVKWGQLSYVLRKDRPHIPLERAVMAIRFNDYMIGTQFHPEADAVGMTMYLQRDDKKKTVIENHGFEKWESMISHLNDPDKILWTYSHIIPNFLSNSIEQLIGAEV
jgi:GMP synthase-like glutamine amidotransferase